MRLLLGALFAMLACAASAAEFRFNGSLSSEVRSTPLDNGSPLNPGNVADLEEESAAGDINLFAGATSDSRRWQFHFKGRGEASTTDDDGFELGEAWLRVNVTPWLDVTAGRVIEKWGTGYAWNPVAFISPEKNPADPSDRRSAYKGREMIRADVFVRDSTLSLYALEEGVFAARGYRLVGGTDVALHLRVQDGHTDPGISLARVFGDALELHAEVARDRAVVGGHYTFARGTNVMLELYRNGEGPRDADWNAFRQGVASASDGPSLGRVAATYAPLAMGREYAFVRLSHPFTRSSIDVEALAIANLHDGSIMARFMVSRTFAQRFSIYLLDTEFTGRQGSELSYMPIERSTVIGARIWF